MKRFFTVLALMVMPFLLREIALRFLLPPGQSVAIEYLSDQVKINLPVIRLLVSESLTINDNIRAVGFISTNDAIAIDPTYVINPRNSTFNRVELPLLNVPNVQDAGQLVRALILIYLSSRVLPVQRLSYPRPSQLNLQWVR